MLLTYVKSGSTTTESFNADMLAFLMGETDINNLSAGCDKGASSIEGTLPSNPFTVQYDDTVNSRKYLKRSVNVTGGPQDQFLVIGGTNTTYTLFSGMENVSEVGVVTNPCYQWSNNHYHYQPYTRATTPGDIIYVILTEDTAMMTSTYSSYPRTFGVATVDSLLPNQLDGSYPLSFHFRSYDYHTFYRVPDIQYASGDKTVVNMGRNNVLFIGGYGNQGISDNGAGRLDSGDVGYSLVDLFGAVNQQVGSTPHVKFRGMKFIRVGSFGTHVKIPAGGKNYLVVRGPYNTTSLQYCLEY